MDVEANSEGLSVRSILGWIGRLIGLALLILLVYILVIALAFVLPFWLGFAVVSLAGLWLIYRIWRRRERFKWVAVGTYALFMIAVFFLPTSVPDIPTVDMPYELVTMSKGENLAVYHIEPDELKSDVPIIFVLGGPGGSVSQSVIDLLRDLSNDLGRHAYTFDHYGAGNSDFVSPDFDALTVADEVRRVRELIEMYGVQSDDSIQASLLGHSYAGVVIGRILAWHPGIVDKFVSLDTSGLHTLDEGNLGDNKLVYNEEYRAMLDPSYFETEEDNSDAGSPWEIYGRVREALSVRQILRGAAMLIKPMKSSTSVPTFGSHVEASYYFEFIFLMAARDMLGGEGVPKYRGLGLASQSVNGDLRKVGDYVDDLLAIGDASPAVLVVHPEEGLLPWPIHKDYESFFSPVYFLPVAGGDHSNLWGTEEAASKVTYLAILTFLKDGEYEGGYTGLTDPFEE